MEIRLMLCMVFIFLFQETILGQVLRTWPDQSDLLFLTNPAVSSEISTLTLAVYHARRFKGLQSSPTESSMAVVLPVKDQKMTLGLHLFSDKTGPLIRNGLEMNYAYSFRSSLTAKDRISLGMALRLHQLNLDDGHFNPAMQSDLLLQDLEAGGIMPPGLKVGFQYNSGHAKYENPVQIKTGVSIGQFLPFADRFNSFDLQRTTEWYTNLGLQVYLSEVTFLYIDMLAKNLSIVPTNYALRLRLDHHRFGWVMTQLAKTGLLSTQIGFRILQSRRDVDLIRIAVGSSWNLSSINAVLGNGLSFGIFYTP